MFTFITSRRPFGEQEVRDLHRGTACPVCHDGKIHAREITTRRKGHLILLKQIYCPACGSTGQVEQQD